MRSQMRHTIVGTRDSAEHVGQHLRIAGARPKSQALVTREGSRRREEENESGSTTNWQRRRASGHSGDADSVADVRHAPLPLSCRGVRRARRRLWREREQSAFPLRTHTRSAPVPVLPGAGSGPRRDGRAAPDVLRVEPGVGEDPLEPAQRRLVFVCAPHGSAAAFAGKRRRRRIAPYRACASSNAARRASLPRSAALPLIACAIQCSSGCPSAPYAWESGIAHWSAQRTSRASRPGVVYAAALRPMPARRAQHQRTQVCPACPRRRMPRACPAFLV
jgi:hypothetical protein